jgi:hypothetical protein
MRWRKFKLLKKPERQVGSQRIKNYFALLPVHIDDEVRWLERVKILQTTEVVINISNYVQKRKLVWKNKRFLN